jgi:hypothetical protein
MPQLEWTPVISLEFVAKFDLDKMWMFVFPFGERLWRRDREGEAPHIVEKRIDLSVLQFARLTVVSEAVQTDC